MKSRTAPDAGGRGPPWPDNKSIADNTADTDTAIRPGIRRKLFMIGSSLVRVCFSLGFLLCWLHCVTW